jgi:hypothetical protein
MGATAVRMAPWDGSALVPRAAGSNLHIQLFPSWSNAPRAVDARPQARIYSRGFAADAIKRCRSPVLGHDMDFIASAPRTRSVQLRRTRSALPYSTSWRSFPTWTSVSLWT